MTLRTPSSKASVDLGREQSLGALIGTFWTHWHAVIRAISGCTGTAIPFVRPPPAARAHIRGPGQISTFGILAIICHILLPALAIGRRVDDHTALGSEWSHLGQQSQQHQVAVVCPRIDSAASARMGPDRQNRTESGQVASLAANPGYPNT